MQKFSFQYQFEGKGIWNNSGSSVKRSDKKKNQNGHQNPRWLPISSLFHITPHNFCTIESRMVILVSVPWFSYIESYFQVNA